MSRLGRILFFLAGALLLAWGALGLHFQAPPRATLWIVAWLATGFGILLFVRPFASKFIAFAVLLALWSAWWSTIRPSNDRDWQPDVANPAWVEIDGTKLTIHNVRNFDYRTETDYTPHWETRTYDTAHLDRLDLFLSYWGSPSIAHTIMSWSFDDGQHLAISIETRKEVGESYDAVAGFFRRYELYYVVADERDLIRLRSNYRGETVHLYPLRTPRDRSRKMLLDYVASINALAKQPEWYNAATQNCTTTIRTHVRNIGLTWAWDWRVLVNGYIDELVYERGVIDTSRPFAVVHETSVIDAAAKAADQDPDFSARIRVGSVMPPLLY